MSFNINIGTDSLVKFTNRLEKMHKSDLPVVVRQTLNRAAFDTRFKTMPKVYNKQFENRSKGFLKHAGAVKPAKGWDTKNMSSWVGIRAGVSKAVTGLGKQEKGASVERTFIPLKGARIGSSSSKKIASKSQLSKVDFRNPIPKRNKRKMIAAAHRAGKGGYIAYGKRIYRVMAPTKKGVKLKPLYAFKKDRKVKIQPRPFVSTAAAISGKSLGSNFVKLANARIRR